MNSRKIKKVTTQQFGDNNKPTIVNIFFLFTECIALISYEDTRTKTEKKKTIKSNISSTIAP